MREIFEAKSKDTGDLFFFKGQEFGALMSAYSRAIPTCVVRDYHIDGNGEDFVCFSMLTDARAKENPVLSFEKTRAANGDNAYKLYSRVSGNLKTYNGSFISLTKRLEAELSRLQMRRSGNVVRANFGSPRR